MLRFYLAGFVGLVVQMGVIKSSYACKSDADCKGDRICEADRCVSPKVASNACRQDTDCRGNDVCEQSVCVPPATPAAPTLVAAATPAPMAAPVAVAAPAPMPAPVAAAMPAPMPAPVAAAPAAAPAATPTAAPADVAPPYAQPGPTPAPAVPSAGAPAATARQTAPAAAPRSEAAYKSIALLVPDRDDFYGISAHIEDPIKSMAGTSWTPTYGALYEGIFYTGDAPVKTYTQTLGMTVGIRPAGPRTVSFALRGGAMLTYTSVEFNGAKSNDFDVALMASGDLMLGYLMVGAQAWMRDGTLWMGRAGFAW